MTVTKNTIIAEILNNDPTQGCVPIFLSTGMHCLGCMASHGETVEEACAVHGVDADELVDELNPLVLACDLRPGPLEKARVTCAPYGDKVQCRLGSGLSVLEPGEVDDIIIAGMGAETIIEILEAAPWVFDARYNLVLAPATKHSILRRWLARRGFALRAETLCQAAGRWYAVMNAQYTGAAREPDGLFCLTGLTNGQPGCSEYYAVQNEKLKKYRLGLPEGEENEAVGKLIAELEHLSKP